MKKIKFIALILSVTIFGSCDLFEKETILDANSEGSNLASFENANITYSQVATGDEYTFKVKMKVKGPTVMDMTNDVAVNLEIDAASTAVEGTHFRIENKSVSLTKANNYLAQFDVVMITTGIVAPLTADPTIVLNAKTTSANVVGSGKPTNIKLVYGCLSHFEGTYNVTTVLTDYDGTVYNLAPWTEDITKIGVEKYRTTRVGHWTVADLDGTPGYTFLNKCDALTVPGQNLVDLYGNWVQGTGTVDDATGNIHMEYSICYPQGADHCRFYVVDYVKSK